MAYTANFPFDSSELLAWLLFEYRLTARRTEIRAGYHSTVVFIDTPEDRFVLKCVKQTVQVEQDIATRAALADRLISCGLPVPRLIPACSQAPVVLVAGFALSLWTFLHGDLFTPGTRDQILAAGSTLARFHLASKNGCVEERDESTPYRGRLKSQIDQSLSLLHQRGGEARALSKSIGMLTTDGSPDGEAARPIWTHMDYRAQNLLYAGNSVAAILDLDDAKVAPRIADLAYALAFFQAVIAPGPLDESEMALFLKSYHQVYPLGAQEIVSIPGWLGLALAKGLTLWGRILFLDQVNSQAGAWIEAYLPLLKKVDRLGDNLQSCLTA
jgi:homoserine kinase type II